MREMKKSSLGCKLAAYSLAAGAAGLASTAQATVFWTDNGGAGWFDARAHFGGTTGGYDMILFALDGTVLVDDAAIDPVLPKASSIELKGSSYNGEYYWGDGKTRDSAYLRVTNAGVVGGWWSAASEATKVAYGGTINATSQFVTGDAEGDVGLYGYGWYSVVGGFGGTGYLGFYMDDGADRYYGWAHINVNGSRNEFTLYSLGISDTIGETAYAGMGTYIPEPMTMSLLALGATGLLARRKRA